MAQPALRRRAFPFGVGRRQTRARLEPGHLLAASGIGDASQRMHRPIAVAGIAQDPVSGRRGAGVVQQAPYIDFADRSWPGEREAAIVPLQPPAKRERHTHQLPCPVRTISERVRVPRGGPTHRFEPAHRAVGRLRCERRIERLRGGVGKGVVLAARDIVDDARQPRNRIAIISELAGHITARIGVHRAHIFDFVDPATRVRPGYPCPGQIANQDLVAVGILDQCRITGAGVRLARRLFTSRRYSAPVASMKV